jgi:hypothetical protein
MLVQKNILLVMPKRFHFSTTYTKTPSTMPVGIFGKFEAILCSMVQPQQNRIIQVSSHIWGKAPIGVLLNIYLICCNIKFFSQNSIKRKRTLNLYLLIDTNQSWVLMTRLPTSHFLLLHTTNSSPRNSTRVRNYNI